jgi:archaellin
MIISYIDGDVAQPDMAYTATELSGDDDGVLEPGEVGGIRIDLRSGCPACAITANHTFTMEIKPATGSYLVAQRTTPSSLSATSIELD